MLPPSGHSPHQKLHTKKSSQRCTSFRRCSKCVTFRLQLQHTANITQHYPPHTNVTFHLSRSWPVIVSSYTPLCFSWKCPGAPHPLSAGRPCWALYGTVTALSYRDWATRRLGQKGMAPGRGGTPLLSLRHSGTRCCASWWDCSYPWHTLCWIRRSEGDIHTYIPVPYSRSFWLVMAELASI